MLDTILEDAVLLALIVVAGLAIGHWLWCIYILAIESMYLRRRRKFYRGMYQRPMTGVERVAYSDRCQSLVDKGDPSAMVELSYRKYCLGKDVVSTVGIGYR